MLIVIGGLPGCGKTTIARLLAQRLSAVYLRIDTIEQAIRSADVLQSDVGPAGYMTAYRLAEDNLRNKAIVVADCVNPLKVTRDAWLATAENMSCKAVEIEVVCSDLEEHRRRIETRIPDIPGLAKLSWKEVIQRFYDPWERKPIVIDTSVQSVEAAIETILVGLRLKNPRAPDMNGK